MGPRGFTGNRGPAGPQGDPVTPGTSCANVKVVSGTLIPCSDHPSIGCGYLILPDGVNPVVSCYITTYATDGRVVWLFVDQLGTHRGCALVHHDEWGMFVEVHGDLGADFMIVAVW